MFSAGAENKRKADVKDLAILSDFYEKKNTAKILSAKSVDLMQLFCEIRPIEKAADVKLFIEQECAFDVDGTGKKIVFVRGKEKNSSQGGMLVTGTCDSCNQFKLVWRASRTTRFVVKPSESNLNHGVVNERGEIIGECTSIQRQATQADVLNSTVFQTLASMPESRSIKVIKKTLGAGPTPLITTDDVIKKALALQGRVTPADHLYGFKLLSPALEAYQNANPAFRYDLEACPLGLFKRLTVVLPHAQEASKYMFNVCGLDAAHCAPVLVCRQPRTLLKSNTLSMVTGRTPNNTSSILSFTIGYSENSDDLDKLINTTIEGGVPLNDPKMTIMTDGGLAIVKSTTKNQSTIKFHIEKRVHDTNQ